MARSPRGAPADAAPPIPQHLPWASREDKDLAYAEPPRPLAIHADLTAEDVEQIQSLAAGRKLSFPWVLAVVAYFGLKYTFGDAIPDFALYALLGLTFVINTLLSMRKDTDHYAAPGRVTMTFSADGVEVSAERWAGHVPWVLVDKLTRTDEVLVLHAATNPSFHALPVRGLGPGALAAIDVWAAYAAQRRKARPGRALLWLSALALLAYAAFTVWERMGRPLPSP